MAFVFGGGGKWGAVQVGMLSALVERGVRPDVVVGCSVGALNGAAFAGDPTPSGVATIRRLWEGAAGRAIAEATVLDHVRSVVGRRPYLYEPRRLREAVGSLTHTSTFEDLDVPFQCVAASIEAAEEYWFTSGPLREALMASCAIPGLFPPVEIAGQHFYDGGLVNSIPLDRAVALGSREVYVLQVGRVEQPLRPPRRLYEAPLVAFDIARRHRFATFRTGLPAGVVLHVLPSGHRLVVDDPRQLAWRRLDGATDLITAAYEASVAYLDGIDIGIAPDEVDS
ncbi:MAG TPA: patatin-like phospholipase family protein [Candidatus Lustribacter sp.]|nr:patatin-like phospholipase family protein [Candidatus Lustribacter sp.]